MLHSFHLMAVQGPPPPPPFPFCIYAYTSGLEWDLTLTLPVTVLGGVSKHPLGLPGAKAVTPWVLFFFLPFYMIARNYFLFGSPSFYLFLQPVQKRARSYHTPQWELHSDFHPQQVLPNHQQWVSSDGDILTAQGVTAYNTHISPDKIPDVISGKAIGDLSNLAFRDPNSF